jgi:hypothetical protein
MPSSETETRSRGAWLSIETGPRARAGGGVRPLSEAESRSRGRPTLERDGTSPEGGDRPSSEAKLYRGDAVPLERSGVPPRGWLGRLFDGLRVCGFDLRVCLGLKDI